MSTLLDQQGRAAEVLRRFSRTTAAMLLLVVVAGSVALEVASSGSFLEGPSVRVFLQYLATPILIGLAQMVALCVGQLNLAVGALGGFTACLTGVLMADHGVPAVIAVLVGLLTATAVGLVTGIVIVATQINGFIVTLATMTILLGAQYRLVGTRTVDGYSPTLRDLGTAAPLDTPLVFVTAIVAAGLLGAFMYRTVAGRRLLAAGGNPLAARLSGISTDRQIVLAHTLSGLLVGVAAVTATASLPGVNHSVGGDWLLPSFAAPIIGGVALTGGSIAVFGTVLAAFVTRLIDAARAQFSLDPSWVNLLIGLVVLGTVAGGHLHQTRLAKSASSEASPQPEGAR
ncbi:monosaccharide ABC transporter membrane protein (CUT2 family) [Streptomyces sp. Ag109_O5-1]|uniref:ABC transporter permease n=1 Tax=Streptomyces sp. Ag109_O5-1 TaxID=1938851 RepID=UPI000F4D8FEE|nr:ABC transporter permease [Streptomyces sp. Ag109_O5-1]RPE46453.1 monosaccharide ABC transporter membrane protein (CUT2 family) [Streptomyces sp. Ag109_O5-1]